ncbi:hypothetical protein SADUNF_Sadunf17G0133600 [Salix dunnii]|uniref:Uncharacterized protein n=1 Tax=Salix dunnii TaxID=1413687 RepID=A0A835MF73_9ROSI|nr:hypothetical protein SADUNF_Sadunf17G0133600 [Salix dunnii]
MPSPVIDWRLKNPYWIGYLGKSILRRAELNTLVDMHGNEVRRGGELTPDETTIITGALDLTQKTAKDAMTPISEIFSMDISILNLTSMHARLVSLGSKQSSL